MRTDSLTNIDCDKNTSVCVPKTSVKYMKKYKKNIFFDNLYNLMKNNEFKKFYNNYIDSWDNCNVVIMYFKLFETIETEYFKKYNKDISEQQMNTYLNKIMNDSTLRGLVINSFDKYKKTTGMKSLDLEYSNSIQHKKKIIKLELKELKD